MGPWARGLIPQIAEDRVEATCSGNQHLFGYVLQNGRSPEPFPCRESGIFTGLYHCLAALRRETAKYFATPSFPPDHFSLVVTLALFSSFAHCHLHLTLLAAEIVALHMCDGTCPKDRQLYAALQTAEIASSSVRLERVPRTTNRIGLLQLTSYEADTSLRF